MSLLDAELMALAGLSWAETESQHPAFFIREASEPGVYVGREGREGGQEWHFGTRGGGEA